MYIFILLILLFRDQFRIRMQCRQIATREEEVQAHRREQVS